MNFLHDLQHAWRRLSRRRTFLAIAILSLALGIGANTAIFSFVHGVLLAPLPYPEAERILSLEESEDGRPAGGGPERRKDWDAQRDVLEAVAGYYGESMTLTGGDTPERIWGVRTFGDLLAVYGVQPVEGRNFTEDERAGKAEAAALITAGFRARHFGNGEALGRRLVLDGKGYRVVGVIPGEVAFRKSAVIAPDTSHMPRSARFLRQLGRLRADVSMATAQERLSVVARHLAAQYPATDRGLGIRLIPLQQDVTGDARTPLLVLLGAVGFVLLSACLNVASLLLQSAGQRRREVAVRRALGASPWRIARLVLSEGLILGVLGGAAGLLLAAWGLDVLKEWAPASVPRLDEVRLNWAVAGFAAAVSLLTALVCSLAPAVDSSTHEEMESLRAGGRVSTRRRWMQQGLVMAEVGISLALLMGAGLLFRTLWNLEYRPLGFRSERLISFQVPISWQTPDGQTNAIITRVLEQVRSLPGVHAAEFTDRLPLEGGSMSGDPALEGRAAEELSRAPQVYLRPVSEGYLTLMEVPLVAGRHLAADDARPGVRRTVINQTAARTYFGGRDPVGQRIGVQGRGASRASLYEIVGVVGDLYLEPRDREAKPSMFVPYQTSFWPIGTFVVRSSQALASLGPALRAAVARVDRNQVVDEIRPVDSAVKEGFAEPRLNAWLVGMFAVAALLLAAMGIYGLLANRVAERAQEIGIRMALGAQRSAILRLVVMSALRPVLLGLALGALGAWWMQGALSKILFGVAPSDPGTAAGAVMVLAAAALAASWLPARRAARVDPVIVLRQE